MNFSVFLGNPSEVHSPPNPNPHPQRRPPSPKENKRKKSSRKIQRDNERAARYQENKRKELAAASAASGNPTSPLNSSKVQDKTRDKQQAPASAASGGDPPQTSSPAEPSSVRASSVEFSFASPVAEDKSSNAMEGVSDPQLSPENLRHQLEDLPSLTRSQNEEIVREDFAEPIPENTTISEEALQEHKDTASKPRLRLASSEPCLVHAQAQEGMNEELFAALMDQLSKISGDLKEQKKIYAQFQSK